MYGVYSRAITKGRNNPDPNIEDLICVRSNQWCIRTRDSIKCKKLYTGLDRRILTCYNSAVVSGYSEVGIAPGLGVPWRYPGRGKAKHRKAL